MRVDYAIAHSQASELAIWRQELAGSPFARVLSAAEVRIAMSPANGGTRVTITHAQRLRGSNRTGAWMLARATRKRLDDALAGLATIA